MSDHPAKGSYDEWVAQTQTIRDWVNHKAVSETKLYDELVFWVESHDRMREAQQKCWDAKDAGETSGA